MVRSTRLDVCATGRSGAWRCLATCLACFDKGSQLGVDDKSGPHAPLLHADGESGTGHEKVTGHPA